MQIIDFAKELSETNFPKTLHCDKEYYLQRVTSLLHPAQTRVIMTCMCIDPEQVIQLDGMMNHYSQM